MTFTPKNWTFGSVVDNTALQDLETRLSNYTESSTWGSRRRGYYKIISGATIDTFDRDHVTGNTVAVSGQLYLNAIELPAGYVVSNFWFRTAATAMAGGTNQWAALFNSSYLQLACTADQGLAALGQHTTFSWPVATIASGASSTYTVPSDGLYFIGIMFKATTPPNIHSKAVFGTQSNPVLAGLSGAATQVGPNAFPFTAGTPPNTSNFYHYLALS